MQQVPGCPFKHTHAAEGVVYRAINADPKHNENFLPAAVKQKARLQRERQPSRKCLMWALSTYESAEALHAMITAMEDALHSNIRKKIGTHCAELTLTPGSGRCTKPDDTGHISLFPYTTFDGSAAISAITEIPP